VTGPRANRAGASRGCQVEAPRARSDHRTDAQRLRDAGAAPDGGGARIASKSSIRCSLSAPSITTLFASHQSATPSGTSSTKSSNSARAASCCNQRSVPTRPADPQDCGRACPQRGGAACSSVWESHYPTEALCSNACVRDVLRVVPDTCLGGEFSRRQPTLGEVSVLRLPLGIPCLTRRQEAAPTQRIGVAVFPRLTSPANQFFNTRWK
jgi:hypothetical protein